CKRSEKWGKKEQQTDDQRAQRKAALESYNAQLQKIMTSDQYAAYTKKMQDRKADVKKK
ncbi:MAG: DUF4890 domain-containing protein, partial [Bacteroides sp.]|nr:DUF4890 domain-containing protein [Bacteroides sp.]